MKIYPADEFNAALGPQDKFTGPVWVSALISAQAEGSAGAYLVMFAPGARTYWHTHAGEQVLYVVTGSGRVAREGEPVTSIHAGDTVHILPGEKHWHGAGPDGYLTHLAVTTEGPAHWMEPVSEDQYSDGVNE